jgi:hypothetical protein
MNYFRSFINSDAQIDKVIIDFLRRPFQGSKSLDDEAISCFDWQIFLKKSFREGVDGLLFDNISQSKQKHNVPDWVIEEMKRNYMANLGRNMLLTANLEKVLDAFEQKKISILLLRGMDFLNRLYQSLGMRNMSDVDFVLADQDIKKAKPVLESLGYKHPPNYPYLYDNDCLFIDLHKNDIGSYNLAKQKKSPSIKSESIWKESIAYKNKYHYVRTLSIYDSIITCCSHLQEHSFSRLIWFYDVARLIQNQEPDFEWEKLTERAYEFGLEKPVFYVLKYLDTKQILKMPDNIFEPFAGLRFNKLELRSMDFLIKGRRKDVSGELLYLFSKKGIRSKLKGFWESVFIKKEDFHLNVGRITIWHYIKRFFTISLYGLKKMFKLITA